MNKTQALDRYGEILGILYWHERGTFPKEPNVITALETEKAEIEARLNANAYPPETNRRGNEIERAFWSAERYPFDFILKWEQFDTDQDAWYYGIWVNAETLQVLSYTEGDITLISCPDKAHFAAELQSMNEFYTGQPPAMICIDSAGVTEIYDERPTAEKAAETPQDPLTLEQILKIVKEQVNA